MSLRAIQSVSQPVTNGEGGQMVTTVGSSDLVKDQPWIDTPKKLIPLE